MMTSFVMASFWQRLVRRVFSVTKPSIGVAFLPILFAACSEAPDETPQAGGQTGDDRLFVPEGLSVTKPTDGSSGEFTLTALTLKQGSANTEVYLALRNDGEVPACAVAFAIELFDANGEVLATNIRGLPVRQFYRFKLDPTAEPQVAGCVAPGEVSMGAILDFPPLEVEFSLSYRLTYWDLSNDIAPLEGNVTVNDVKAVMRGGGTAYTGVVVNGLDTPRSPGVSIFPVNRVGRPLGVAYSQGNEALPPGGRWEFETTSVSEVGTGFVAYPAGM